MALSKFKKMTSAVKNVNRIIKPIVTPTLQTMTLMSVGDILAQTLVGEKGLTDINLVRTGQFACLGLFVVGPLVSIWFRILVKLFGTNGFTVSMKKVLVDQTLCAPIMIVIYIISLGIIQGESLEAIRANLNHHYFDILKANYIVWPAVQFVNFAFVPVSRQVLFLQSVAVTYNTYLSWKTQHHKEEIDKQKV